MEQDTVACMVFFQRLLLSLFLCCCTEAELIREAMSPAETFSAGDSIRVYALIVILVFGFTTINAYIQYLAHPKCIAHKLTNLFSPINKIGSFTFCLTIMDCLCIQAGMHLCRNFRMYLRSQPMWNKATKSHNVHDTIIQTRIPVCMTSQFPLMTLLVHGILCTCTPFCMNV